MTQGATLRVRGDVLEHADRHALADAGALVDAPVRSRLERDLLDDFPHPGGQLEIAAAAAIDPRFLAGDLHRHLPVGRVVGPNLGADAILQRRDDLAARRVVLGVGRERHQDVEPQADRVALNLDVAFLQDVEEPDLNLARQIGKLVDREEPAIGARQQAVVNRLLVAELEAAACRLDRIDVANQVGNRHVGRCQLLDVAQVAMQPGHRQVVARLCRASRGRRRRAG